MVEKFKWFGFLALAILASVTSFGDDVVWLRWSVAKGEKWSIGGFADHEAKRPMTRDTVFAICSNTKPVTSVLVLTLVEDGTLNLDDPVAKYLPEFADIKIKGKDKRDPGQTPTHTLTLRHLITHLSGLRYGVNVPGKKSDRVPYAEQARLAAEMGLWYEPGTKYKYCGLGFQVMGAVIEKVTGKSVVQLMQERIFDPLEMTDTTFYPTAEMMSRVAVVYYRPPKGGDLIRYGFDNRLTLPLDDRRRTALLSGGLFSTVGDYLKFSQMLLRKGVGINGKRILSERMFDEYLLRRQTPPTEKTDSSFDIHFDDPTHAAGGKGGLFATWAKWNWKDQSCSIVFKARSPNAPKGMSSHIDATGFGGPKTKFGVTGVTSENGKVVCTVSNDDDRHGIAKVALVVNGKSLQTKTVELAIGEEKVVEFGYVKKPDDQVSVKVIQ